jgi:hypothetical protein
MLRLTMEDSTMRNADEVARAVASRSRDLLLCDSSFHVELEALNGLLKGEGSACILRRTILEKLPPHEKHEPTHCLSQLRSMAKGGVFRFASREAQSHHKVAGSLLSAVVDQRPMDVADALKNGYLAQVVECMSWFCVVPAEADTPELRGAEAVAKLITLLKAKYEAKSAGLKDILVLRAFFHLVPKAEAERVDEIAKSIVAMAHEGIDGARFFEALQGQGGRGEGHRRCRPTFGPRAAAPSCAASRRRR